MRTDRFLHTHTFLNLSKDENNELILWLKVTKNEHFGIFHVLTILERLVSFNMSKCDCLCYLNVWCKVDDQLEKD